MGTQQGMHSSSLPAAGAVQGQAIPNANHGSAAYDVQIFLVLTLCCAMATGMLDLPAGVQSSNESDKHAHGATASLKTVACCLAES